MVCWFVSAFCVVLLSDGQREASAGIEDGVKWVVFAVGRGQKEVHASLCDFVLGHARGDLFRLVR